MAPPVVKRPSGAIRVDSPPEPVPDEGVSYPPAPQTRALNWVLGIAFALAFGIGLLTSGNSATTVYGGEPTATPTPLNNNSNPGGSGGGG